MSRPRQYWPIRTINRSGVEGWSLVGECVNCGRHDQPWSRRPDCGHRELLPGWWPTRALAVAQANMWQRRQRLLLVGWPDRYRRGPAAA